MLRKLLQRVLPSSAPAPIAQQAWQSAMPASAVSRPSTPVYPPVDAGLQFVEAQRMLDGQHDMLARLRILAGGDTAHYERFYLAIVRQLAAYVQLLPASKSDTHQGAGGLFRLCLEMGFFSLQAAERIVFAGQELVELRRELEPRWRYATFIAGLCSELYRPLSDMIVTDEAGQTWPKHLKSLTDWSVDTGADRYFIQWQKARPLHSLVAGRADVAIVMRSILPDYALQYLEDASSSIIPVVFAVASGSSHPSDNQVAKVVYDTREKILKRDQALRSDHYGKQKVGNHLDPYFLDAMRHLYRTGAWTINGNKSRLWYSLDGLFLIWKSAAKDIIQHTTDNGVAGVPRDIATLADMLCDAGITERNGASPLWVISTRESADEWQALKISKPVSVLEDDEIEPVQVSIKKGQAAPTKPGTAPVKAASVSAPATDVAAETTAVAESAPANKPPKIKARPKESKPQPEPIDAQRDLMALVGHVDTPVATSETNTPSAQLPADAGSANNPGTGTSQTASAAPAVPAAQRPRAKPAENADPDAEIAPPMAVSSYADNVSEGARAGLKPDILEVVGKMIDDYRKGKNKASILDVPQGIAFENQQILRYGVTFDRLIGLLHSNDWLESPAGNPNGKIIKVQGPAGRNMNCIVIKHKAAIHLGFKEG